MKKKGKVMTLIEKGMKFGEEHQREFMLGAAIAGSVITAVTAWKAGIKADKILSEQKEKMEAINQDYSDNEKFDDEDLKMSEEEYKNAKREVTIETIKKMAPIVAPPVLACTGTIISVVSGYKVASKQIAVVSSLYTMSEKALSEYQDKAKELIGAKKAQEIVDSVNQDKVKKNPPETKEVFNTGNGKTLCLDDMSGRYFYSSAEDIRKAFNTINKRMMDEYYISLNELYNELGLPEIVLGEDMGFNIDDGLVDIDHLFTAAIHKDDPILVLCYEVSGKYTEHRGRMFR